jgi:hypothetical protein
MGAHENGPATLPLSRCYQAVAKQRQGRVVESRELGIEQQHGAQVNVVPPRSQRLDAQPAAIKKWIGHRFYPGLKGSMPLSIVPQTETEAAALAADIRE